MRDEAAVVDTDKQASGSNTGYMNMALEVEGASFAQEGVEVDKSDAHSGTSDED